MNTQEDPRTLIAGLGALEVQIAARLLHEPLPVTQTHLCNVLHKTDKTVARALYNLELCEICSHSPLGWSNTPEGEYRLFGIRRLPDAPQLAVEPETSVEKAVQKGRKNSDSPPKTTRNTSRIKSTRLDPEENLPDPDPEPVDNPVEKGRNFSDSPPLTTSSTRSIKLTKLDLEKNLLLVPDPKTEQEPEFKPKPEPERKPKSAERIRACHQAALEVGIGEPKATSIANLPHVTPELIRQHVKAALAERQRIGLAIHRLENNHTLQKTDEQESSEQEEQEKLDWEDRQRYIGGKYADRINH